MPGSLTAVGTGIKIIAQTTPEALACIRRAEKLYFVAADPLTERWLRELNSTAESLHSLYEAGKDRRITYEEMVTRVLDAVASGLEVCFASYGHPGVFAHPLHESVRRARQGGYAARMLPGISADACLFADLGVDPAGGCQSFEATDFLVYRRRFDAASALVLWQIGIIGELEYRAGFELCNVAGIRLLLNALLPHYDAGHEVTVYEASRYACCKPDIQKLPLERIVDARITALSTLYVPPAGPSAPDFSVLQETRHGGRRCRYKPRHALSLWNHCAGKGFQAPQKSVIYLREESAFPLAGARICFYPDRLRTTAGAFGLSGTARRLWCPRRFARARRAA